MLHKCLLNLVARLANVEQEGRRGGLLGNLESVQTTVLVRWWGLLLLLLLRLLLLRKLVHLVLHVGKVGQLIVEMAVKQLDPQHQLALLVAGNEVVEELQAGDEQLLVGVDDALPLVLVVGAGLAIVAAGRDAHADVDEGEDVLVEEALGAEVLHALAMYLDVTGDADELVEALEVAQQAGRIAGNQRPRQALVLGGSRVGRCETAPLERGQRRLEHAGHVVPELPGEAQLLAQFKALAAGIERLLDYIALEHAQRVVAHVAWVTKMDRVGREGEAQAREVRAGGHGVAHAGAHAISVVVHVVHAGAVPGMPQPGFGEQRAVHPYTDRPRRAQDAEDVVRG